MGDGQCSTWPATPADPYRGPWDRGTTPVLVLGPTNDPSTPFENSQKTVCPQDKAPFADPVPTGS